MSCCVAEPGVKPNSIYFVEECERCLWVFDLEDHAFSMILPCPTVRCYPKLDWIML